MRRLLAISVVTLVLFGSTAHGQLIEWTVASGGNGHFYEAVSVPGGITWANAQAAAVSQGGYLATTLSAAENTFVFNLIDSPTFWFNQGAVSLGPWLGGFQATGSPEPGGGWQWVNGDGPFSYTNWASTEPSNEGGIEDRIHFFGLGVNNRQSTWNDQAGSSALIRGYVIEINAVPEPSSLAFGAFAVLAGTRRYWRGRRGRG